MVRDVFEYQVTLFICFVHPTRHSLLLCLVVMGVFSLWLFMIDPFLFICGTFFSSCTFRISFISSFRKVRLTYIRQTDRVSVLRYFPFFDLSSLNLPFLLLHLTMSRVGPLLTGFRR